MSHRVEETVMQDTLDRFIAARQRRQTVQELIAVASLRPGIYLRAPVVTMKSSRRLAGAGREPATVLLGPFSSDVEARFIQTSAQALGLAVESMGAFPFGSSRGDARAERNHPAWTGFFSGTDLALN